MTEIDKTLTERESRYGKFLDDAKIAMGIKHFLRYGDSDFHVTNNTFTDGWMRLAPDQQHALDNIATKIARILNGNPDYADNWHDIQGYAKLIEDRLNGDAI